MRVSRRGNSSPFSSNPETKHLQTHPERGATSVCPRARSCPPSLATAPHIFGGRRGHILKLIPDNVPLHPRISLTRIFFTSVPQHRVAHTATHGRRPARGPCCSFYSVFSVRRSSGRAEDALGAHAASVGTRVPGAEQVMSVALSLCYCIYPWSRPRRQCGHAASAADGTGLTGWEAGARPVPFCCCDPRPSGSEGAGGGAPARGNAPADALWGARLPRAVHGPGLPGGDHSSHVSSAVRPGKGASREDRTVAPLAGSLRPADGGVGSSRQEHDRLSLGRNHFGLSPGVAATLRSPCGEAVLTPGDVRPGARTHGRIPRRSPHRPSSVRPACTLNI